MTSHDEGWFKVSRRLLDSSRWFREEPATLKLLLFLVAAAQDPLNENPGTVLIGETGLAARTGLSVDYVRTAIGRLCDPDPESRSVEGDGATLARVPGGVRLVNFDLYHPNMVEDAMRKKAARSDKARRAAQARWAREQRDAE
ncbi:MAG: hypothetical protein ACM33U_08605 [Solirubrobacterales bacterium]